MKGIIKALLIIDIGIIIFTLLSGNQLWFINSQIAFITSSLIMFASMISYRNMVNNRVELGMVIAEDNRDTIDRIEDPYDIFGEDEVEDTAQKTFKEIVQEEKDQLKKSKRSLWQTTKDSKAALSFYRLGAYFLLILGFFYLNNNKILDISSYLLALSLPPIVVVMMLMRQK